MRETSKFKKWCSEHMEHLVKIAWEQGSLVELVQGIQKLGRHAYRYRPLRDENNWINESEVR